MGFTIDQPVNLVITTGIGYLNDKTHLLFSLGVAFGGTAGEIVLNSIHETMIKLESNQVIQVDKMNVLDHYHRYRKIANNLVGKLGSLVLAITTLYVFY